MWNKPKILKKLQEGFTGVDVLLTLVISSAITVGMSYVYLEVTEKLRVEEIRSDVLKYGNRILDDIENDMIHADNVTFEEFQTHSKIFCTTDNVTITYSIDPVNGIMKDGLPFDSLPGSTGRFNNTNSAGQTSFQIFKFECDPIGITSDNTNARLGGSVFEVKMFVDVYNTDEKLVDEVFFNRRIYAVNHYLNSTSE